MLIRDIDCNILMPVCMKSNPTVRQLIQFRGDSIKFNSEQYCEEKGRGGGGWRRGRGMGGRRVNEADNSPEVGN